MRGRLALILGALVLSPLGRAAAEGPTVVRDVLPGGLRLLVRYDPNPQVVTVSLQVRSGARYDTPETAGLGNLVQRVMIRGTARRSARQIVEAAEDIGGSLEASADVEHAEIRGGALALHARTLLDLIAEVALSPAFPPDEVERERRLVMSQIQTRAETPFALALDALTAQLYGLHPLALPTLREEQGLAYSLGMVNPARRNPASFVAYIATSEHAESGLRQEIERFRADGPSAAEVARAKAYVLGNLAMDRRTNARHAWYLAFFELAGFGWDYPERYARALEAVSVPDVTRVAHRYLANPARSW